MPPQHMDRLSSVDASFLTQETSASHMHVGAVSIFEGPPPSYDDLLEHVRSRLHLVPRFRQKLAFPPMELGRPFWIDDPSFNLSYHVRHSALPSPGSEEQLRNMAARVFSQQLDRTKPLWELWLVQGLKRKRFALISKTHHARRRRRLRGRHRDGAVRRQPGARAGRARARVGARARAVAADLAARGVEGIATTPLRFARRLVGAVEHPGPAVEQATEAVEALGEVAWSLANPAPEVPLNVEIGSHRRFDWVRAELARASSGSRTRFGGTVNDVVLAVVSGALRRWLRARGVRTEGLELRALVPVSIRAEDEHGQLGNRIAAVRGPLPVYIEDPVRRLEACASRCRTSRRSKQALGAEVISRFNDFAPADAARAGLAAQLLDAAVQPHRHQRPRARRSRSTCSGASSRTSSRSRSCPRTTRSRSRS